MTSKIDHVVRARIAYKKLRRAARSGKFTYYKKLANAQGLHHRSARWFLGVIQDEMDQLGLPPLQALCVRKDTRRPGTGYVASKREGASYRKAVKSVFTYSWPKKCPF